MQSLKSISFLAVLFSLSLFVLSCGGNTAQDPADAVQTEEPATAEAADTTTEAVTSDMAPHGEGKEYTSAYVCPMHCKGSGSEEAGTCPVCGMDYVALAEHVKDGHMH